MDKGKKSRLELGFVVLVFLLYFGISCFLPVKEAPDEYMRYVIPEYIYTHHSLPVGTDPAVIDETWGFSYGFTPYLPSMVAALLMWIVSLFTQSVQALIVASRLVSSFAAAGAVWISFRIGERLFERTANRWLFSVCIALLPQFVFLAAYLNNDTVAVFSAMVMFYAWLRGRELHWNYRSCALLAAGIICCTLTYYNAYGWILCSILFYFGSIWQDDGINSKIKHACSHGIWIAVLVIVFAGWFFIRNAILYDGDFLGMNTMYACAEQYGYGPYKPSNRVIYANMGFSVMDMFRQTDWLPMTLESCFARFGYMEIRVPVVYYVLYVLIGTVGAIGVLLRIAKKKIHRADGLLCVCSFFCVLIPLILSVKYSYTIDFQPQGRYLMSALPAVAFLIARGYQWLDEEFFKKRGIFSSAVTVIWAVMFTLIFVTVMIPRLCTGI